MPLAAHSSASDDLIGRDAAAMTTSPAHSFLNPPPVPLTPMVTRRDGSAFWKASATASEIGYTVLEPSIAMIAPAAPAPPSDGASPRWLLHAAPSAIRVR